MKITRAQFDVMMNTAIERAETGGVAPLTDVAILAGLAAIGIEIEDDRARLSPVEFVWVERTWADVRKGDVIRPDGQADDAHAAKVIAIGPVNRWHAAPGAAQYRPNESPMEWSARRVTMLPLRRPQGDADAQPFTPEHGMRPDAAVDIKITRGELAAIETLGGWHNRIEAAQ